MPSTVQLQLGGPLFFAAVIISNAIWDSAIAGVGVEPPRVQPVMSFVWCNHRRGAAEHRKRNAMAAVHLVAKFFMVAGVRAPAGVCPDRQGPGCLSKLPVWLRQLAGLNATEALQLLAEHAQKVPAELWERVETQYNSGVKAARCGLTLLQPGELARNFASLIPTSAGAEVVPVNHPATLSGVGNHNGTFYYIAAGVGCGIREAEEVCTAASIYGQHDHDAAVDVLCKDRPRLQEGFRCIGACEIDAYCQQVWGPRFRCTWHRPLQLQATCVRRCLSASQQCRFSERTIRVLPSMATFAH
jgi:hypothetical protein